MCLRLDIEIAPDARTDSIFLGMNKESMLEYLKRLWAKSPLIDKVLMGVVLALIVNLLILVQDKTFAMNQIEGFSAIGGFIDLRYGVLGVTSGAGKTGDWIDVATFGLSSAMQEIDVVLEVFGSSRQTFMLKLTNNATTANAPSLLQSNQFGKSNVTFTTAAVVQTSATGLTATYDLYLNLASDGVVDVPAAWYLKGTSTTDQVAITNVSKAVAPSGSNVTAATDPALPAIPVGSIIMWNSATPPTGWSLCDGTNGTPDLRNRFVLGASSGHGLGQTGGEETHTLSVNEMPNHSHSFSLPQGDQNWGNGGGNTFWGGSYGRGIGTNAVGGSAAHNNMPPFYALSYIMKL